MRERDLEVWSLQQILNYVNNFRFFFVFYVENCGVDIVKFVYYKDFLGSIVEDYLQKEDEKFGVKIGEKLFQFQ